MLVPPTGAAFIVKWPSNSHSSQRWALTTFVYLGTNPVFDLLGGPPRSVHLFPASGWGQGHPQGESKNQESLNHAA